jgi:hypothetical protein
MTFRELVDREYVGKGLCKLDAFSRIHAQHKVAFSSMRAAYSGFRVLPDTARSLRVWAAVAHGCELDELAMLSAPTAPRRKAHAVA